MSSAGSPSVESRCLKLPSGADLHARLGIEAHSGRFTAAKRSLPFSLESTSSSPRADLDVRAECSRAATGSSRPSRVGQHREAHRARAAEVEELVQRRAYRAAGVQHVVHQDDFAAVDRERDLAAARFAVQADAPEVVAVQRDREHAQGCGDAERAMQPLGDPDPARVQADQRRIGRELAAHLVGERAYEGFGIGQCAHVRPGGVPSLSRGPVEGSRVSR